MTDEEIINKLTDAAALAFAYHYHKDCGNAAAHTSNPRFSPLTFMLADAVLAGGNETPELRRVKADTGRYPLDAGR